jgi:hypothetical protein
MTRQEIVDDPKLTRDQKQLMLIESLRSNERLETIEEVAERIGVSIDDLSAPMFEERGILLLVKRA